MSAYISGKKVILEDSIEIYFDDDYDEEWICINGTPVRCEVLITAIDLAKRIRDLNR